MFNTQKELFERIAINYRSKNALCKVIANGINASEKTVEKWISGDTVLSYDRLCDIVNLLKLGPMELFGTIPNTVTFHFQPLQMDNLTDYRDYIARFASMLQNLAMDEAMVHFMADEIPIFHFMPYRHLTCFKLYVYYCDMQRSEINPIMKYEEFVGELMKLNLEQIFDEINAAYNKMSSREIWDEAVLDKLLFHIEDIDFFGRFGDRESRKRILDELICLVDSFFEMADKSCKPSGARFDFFKKPYRDGKGFMLISTATRQMLSIKLDIINSMMTEDKGILLMHNKMFEAAMKRSMAIGMGDQRERLFFHQLLIQKIRKTMGGML